MDIETAFILLLLSLAMSFVVAWAAGQKGHSTSRWFLISLVLSPLLALLVLLVIGDKKPKDDPAAAYHAWKRQQAAAAPLVSVRVVDDLSTLTVLKTQVRLTPDGEVHQFTLPEISEALRTGQIDWSAQYYDYLGKCWLDLPAHPRLG